MQKFPRNEDESINLLPRRGLLPTATVFPFPEGNELSEAARRRLDRLLNKPTLLKLKRDAISRKLKEGK